LKSLQIPLRPLFSKGEKEESFIEGIQKGSPPFGKERTGGIYEPPFQKTKLIQEVEIIEALPRGFKEFFFPFPMRSALGAMRIFQFAEAGL
jgi:hypothetical protein